MFKSFSSSTIGSALKGVTRQYFVGNLVRPQKIEVIPTDSLEIGITRYIEHTAEKPHCHSHAMEYQYMISGWTQYRDIDTNEVFEFRKGDFFAIYPGTNYAQKSKLGTEILFIKTPSVNDKQLIDFTPEIKDWLSTRLKTVRTDYYYDEDAPQPNSIKPAAAVAIENSECILMIKRADNGKWSLPGGTQDFGESLSECAVRELKEETGLDIDISDIIATYTDPNIRVGYSDGEVRQEFTVVFFGNCDSKRVNLDSESTAYKWVPANNLLALDMADSQRKRIIDLLRYLSTKEKSIA